MLIRIILVAQAYFWVNVISFYFKLKSEENEELEEDKKVESMKTAWMMNLVEMDWILSIQFFLTNILY